MDKKIEKILKTWHDKFLNADRHYPEFEHSDIEYFVGCLLYNHFAFSKALDTMKTMDLSYDFIEKCGDEYDEIISIIKSIKPENEIKKLEFIIEYIQKVKSTYSIGELYLLNRFENHIQALDKRYKDDMATKKVDFTSPIKRVSNPLERV